MVFCEETQHFFVLSAGKRHRLMTVSSFLDFYYPKLSREDHVESVCGRLYRVLHLLRKLSALSLPSYLFGVYYSLFYSH